jgi:hypothetical protein
MTNEIAIEGLYIYGIIPTHDGVVQFEKLEDTNVFIVPFQEVSAIVSKKSIVDYRQLETQPLARLLLDHQKTIEGLMNMGFTTIIPMRIGTFADNTSGVLSILEKGYELFTEIFGKATNLLEINIVASWSDFGQILAEIAVNPQVLEMKEKIENSGIAITESDQLSIGYLVKTKLDERRDEYATKMINALSPFCQTTKQHEVQNDQMVSNTSFLLEQGQLALLEKALNQLDESLNGQLNLKWVGPLPLYSFYTMEVKELYFEEIELAKNELGLNNSTSEKNIQQAYLDKAKLFHPDMNPSDDAVVMFKRIKKSYHTMLDYITSVKPESREEQFSLSIDAVDKNLFFLKIKE